MWRILRLCLTKVACITVPFPSSPAASSQATSCLHFWSRAKDASFLLSCQRCCSLLHPPFSVFCLYSFSLVTPCSPLPVLLCCMSLVEEIWVEQVGCGVNRKKIITFLYFLSLPSVSTLEKEEPQSVILLWHERRNKCAKWSLPEGRNLSFLWKERGHDVVYKTQQPDLRHLSCVCALQVQDWRVPTCLKSPSKIRTWALTQQPLTVKEETFQCFPWPTMASSPTMGGGLQQEREPGALAGMSALRPRFHYSWALWDWARFLTCPCLSFLLCKIGRWWLPSSTTWAIGWNQHLWQFCVPVEVTHGHFSQVGKIESGWAGSYLKK